jgi:U32 family peptidase
MARPTRRPEVLAPAGGPDAMRAAIRAGADAVYFGLEGFSARARAENFRTDDLGPTMLELHEKGVRGYVALNTLVFDDELGALEVKIRASCAAGVDAIIVQDLAVMRLVREIAPTMPIHASTQMTCTDRAALEVARSLGAERVILPRELSLDDIASLSKDAPVELEVFVHGALCISYSGQCLTSEAIGGRSANRGACAQACRLPYDLVVDGVRKDLGDRAYLLSPQDLDALVFIPSLVRLGVRALKIEGRMKGPDYVQATTSLYKKAVLAALRDAEPPTEEEHQLALMTYSRGSGTGFLGGTDHQTLVDGRSCDHRGVQVGTCLGARGRHGRSYVSVRLEMPLSRGDGILVEGGRANEGEVGGRVWALVVGGREVDRAEARTEALAWLGPDKVLGQPGHGRRVFRTSDPGLPSKLASLPAQRQPVMVDMVLEGRTGEEPRLSASTTDGRRAETTLDTRVEPARSQPLTTEVIRDKLGRLGDTPFVLAKLSVELPAFSTFGISALNRGRRSIARLLLSHPPVPCTDASAVSIVAAAVPQSAPPPSGLFVLCRTHEQARAALDAGAEGVYFDFLDLAGLAPAFAELRSRGRTLGVASCRIHKPGEERILRHLTALEPDVLLSRTLGSLASSVPRIGDFSLNVVNRVSAAEVLARGLLAFTPAYDLDAAQLVTMLASPFAPFAEVVIHHPMPLFYTEHCLYAAHLSKGSTFETCGRPCDHHRISLRDRTGREHPVVADVGCRNTVLHAAAQSGAELVPRLRDLGVRRWRVELSGEGSALSAKIVGKYRALVDGSTTPERFTLDEPGYDLVRGSLRVLS